MNITLGAVEDNEFDGKVKEILATMVDMFRDTSENPYATKLDKQKIKVLRNIERKEKKAFNRNHGASKNVVDDRIKKAQENLPDVGQVAKQGSEAIQKYIKNIVEEIKIGYEKEEMEFDEKVEKFVTMKLKSVIEKLK